MGAMRSSSSLTESSTASASFPVCFLMSSFCSGVSSIRTVSFSFFMGDSHSGGGMPPIRRRPMAHGQSDDRARGDTLLQLLHSQLDRVTLLPDFLLHQLLLLRGQVDADDLLFLLHGQPSWLGRWSVVSRARITARYAVRSSLRAHGPSAL